MTIWGGRSRGAVEFREEVGEDEDKEFSKF